MMRLQGQDAWDPDRNGPRGYSRLVAALTVALVLVFVAAWVSLGFAAVARAADAVPAVKASAPAAPIVPVAPIAEPASAKTDFKVNLNVADLSQLALVPGIGPAKAKAIVTFRAGKSFQSPADLMKVKGIGPKSYAKMKTHLAVDGPAVQGVPPRH